MLVTLFFLPLPGLTLKFTKMTIAKTAVTKESLIQKIWAYCKYTHSNQDYEDLKEFSLEELQEILNDLEINNV